MERSEENLDRGETIEREGKGYIEMRKRWR